MTEVEWILTVWGLALIVWGVVLLQLVDRARYRREQPGHAVGRARAPRVCALCGYTFATDDVYRRGEGGAIVHQEDQCGPAYGRKLARPDVPYVERGAP